MSKSITNAGAGGPKGPTLATPKSRRGFKGFLAEVQREIKKVDWPTKKETTRLTGIVLAVVSMILTVLFLLSSAVDLILSILLHKGGR